MKNILRSAMVVSGLMVYASAYSGADVTVKLVQGDSESDIVFQFNDFTEAVEFLQDKMEEKLAQDGYCDPRISSIVVSKSYIPGMD